MRYKSAEDRAVDIAAIVIVALVAICCLYPIIYCFSMSLSGDDAIVKHAVTLLPVGLNLESYRMVLADMSRHAQMRMYHGAREVWNGFGKNMFTGLGGNYLLLAALLLWYGVLYVLPPVTLLIGVFTGDLHLTLISGGAMLLGMAVKAVCDAFSGLPAWNGVWVWATICCTIAIALSSAAGSIGGKGHEWKGRRYG